MPDWFSLPKDVLVANLVAVPLVWVWAAVAGVPFLRLVRVPLGVAAAPLFGLCYWAAALYLLPFRGGQMAAMVLAVVAFAVSVWIDRRHLVARSRRLVASPASWLLFAAILSLYTLQLCNFVPVGMDASMHATSARLIAQNDGLPRDHAPFAPELPFPAVNLGVPAVAAVAVRCGATPSAATLATVPFAYGCLVLATFALLRPWVPKFGAAGLAVIALFASRGLQETVCWGGYPTVAGVAVGVLAGRVLFDVLRRPSAGSGIAAGFLVGALPLVHGIAAAVWVYVAGAMLLAVATRTKWRQWLVPALAAGVAAALVFGAYLLVGHAPVTAEARDWTRNYQQEYAPKGQGIELLSCAGRDIVRWAGDEPAAGLAVGLVWLLARGRWRAALVVGVGTVAVFGVVLNSPFWVLPGSIALYPERTPYFVNVLFPLALAVGWRAVPLWSRRLRSGWALGLLVGVGLCVPKYVQRYQGTAVYAALPPERQMAVTFPAVDRDGYEMLLWCRDHLDPARDVVEVAYNTAGSHLPSVAGVACTGWHVHCFILPDLDAFHRRRPPTHRIDWNATSDQPGQLFRAGRVAVLKIAR